MEHKEIKCFDCDGLGKVDGTSPECFKPASECCGGCYEKYDCKTCNGTGKIYAEDELSIDYMLMIEAYEKIEKGYNETIKDFNKMLQGVSENGLLEMELLLDNTHKVQLKFIKDQLKRISYHTVILQDAIRNEQDENGNNV